LFLLHGSHSTLARKQLSTILSASSLDTMDVGGDHYGAFQGGSSYGSTNGSVRLGRNGTGGSTKADEAFLLSQATTTAMIAARSILMSGGTEETALKTAKAAAQSVLNPGAADADSVSGKSNTFLRRRKAKRQAEVVASMALMSATSNARATGGVDWETVSNTSGGHNSYPPRTMMPSHHNNMNQFNGYAQNITTRSQDDPSVLSGSTKTNHTGHTHERERNHPNYMLPPKPPTPWRVQKEQPSFEESKPSKPSKEVSPVPRQPSFSTRAPPACDPVPLVRGASERTEISKQIEQVQSRRKNLQATHQDEDSFGNNSADSNKDQESVVRSLNEGSSSCSSEEPEQADDESLDSMGTEDESVQPRSSTTADMKKDFIKNHLDPVLFSFTNAFNAFSCGPMGLNGLMGEEGEDEERAATKGERKSGGEKAVNSNSVEHRDDVDANNLEDEVTDFMVGNDEANFEDAKQQDEDELREVLDSFDQSAFQSASLSSSDGTSRSQSSASADDSEQILSELNMSSSEEGEIQVRSSIRETMEKIVSKSQKNINKYDASNTDVDRTWLSYELRQGEPPVVLTSTVPTVPTVSTVQTPPAQKKEAEEKEKEKKGWFRAKKEAAAAKAAKKARKSKKQATPVY
jgi:hypothetical protein